MPKKDKEKTTISCHLKFFCMGSCELVTFMAKQRRQR